MALSGSYQVIISALGVSLQDGGGTITATQGIEPVDVVLPAAHAVGSWIKTDANTADGALTTGHGIVTGKVDVYWTGGYRYGVDAVVNINALALDGGAGTDFPASANTTITVCQQTALDVSFDGDNLVLLGALSVRGGLLVFRDAGGTVIGDPVELTANKTWGWATGRGVNPLSGDAVASATASHASTVGTSSLRMTGLQYSV